MTKTLATLLACAGLAVPGCGDDSGDGDAPGGTPISYSRTGGIAGGAAELTIDEDGSATVVSGYGPDRSTQTFRIPADELDAVTSGIEAAGMSELDVGISEGCADCFVYELEYGGETATADSVTAPGEFADTTAPLEKLLDAPRK